MATWQELAGAAKQNVVNAKLLTGQQQLQALTYAEAQLNQLLAMTLSGGGMGPGGQPNLAQPPVPVGLMKYSRQQYDPNSVRGWGNLGFPAEGSGAARTAVVFIQGGGWMQTPPTPAVMAQWHANEFSFSGPVPRERSTGLQALRTMVNSLNERGFITWEPAYDFSNGSNPDLCLASIKRAVRWLLAKRQAYGIGKLLIVGHSAGGHLAIRYTLAAIPSALRHAWPWRR
jgi:acetyl esterase/lipase